MTKYALQNLLLASCGTVPSAFAFLGLPTHAITTFKDRRSGSRFDTSRSALIYGWDGDESDSAGNPTYLDEDADAAAQCSAVGIAMAESLSYDSDKAGHLARLAVAFSPPERSLRLDQIENVQVVCVREETIEIEAIICDDGACVSLSVPVKFPRACAAISSDSLEACVYQNLDELDEKVQASLSAIQDDTQSLEDLCLLSTFDNLPSWWISPQYDAVIAEECENIKQLLNEDEFQSDIVALALDALRSLPEGADYNIQQARVFSVGPAGICFKVRAYPPMGGTLQTLDLVYPFGGVPMYSVDSLRAAVLGAVAAAELH